jgi:hypothetical protein
MLPVVVNVAFPDFDILIVSTCGNDALIPGMCPGDLPHRPIVRLKSDIAHPLITLLLDHLLLLLLGQIIPDTADLQKAFAVTGCHLGPIVVKLAVIDVVLVLSVNRKGFGTWVLLLNVGCRLSVLVHSRYLIRL